MGIYLIISHYDSYKSHILLLAKDTKFEQTPNSYGGNSEHSK